MNNIQNQGIDKALHEFTNVVEPLGFLRTKKWFWVREKSASADFIHLHLEGSSYGSSTSNSISFRVHCGHRHFDESAEGLILNGPSSADPGVLLKRYHLRFNAKTGSTLDRCVEDLLKFVKEIGEPWYLKQLLYSETLQNPENIKKSKKLLGLKNSK